MKTATVSDLRNHSKTLLAWLDEGEEILIVALVHTSRHPEYWKGR